MFASLLEFPTSRPQRGLSQDCMARYGTATKSGFERADYPRVSYTATCRHVRRVRVNHRGARLRGRKRSRRKRGMWNPAARVAARVPPWPSIPRLLPSPTRPQRWQIRKCWAALIRRVYEVDPLLCVWGAMMRIVAVTTERSVITKILPYLGRVAAATARRSTRRCSFYPRSVPAPRSKCSFGSGAG